MSRITPAAELRHLRRTRGITAECDATDPRLYATEPADVTCPACQLAYARRQIAWHRELKRTIDRKTGPFGGRKKTR